MKSNILLVPRISKYKLPKNCRSKLHMTHKRLDVSDLTRIMATTTTSIGRLLAPNKDYNSKAVKYSYQGKKNIDGKICHVASDRCTVGRNMTDRVLKVSYIRSAMSQ